MVDECGEVHSLNNEEKEKCLEHFIERETAVVRMWVEVAEIAIYQEQEEMGNADKVGLTTT